MNAHIPTRLMVPTIAAWLFLASLAFLRAADSPVAYPLRHAFPDPGTNRPAGAQHGSAVAVDGNIAVVGAPLDDLGAADSGVVHVYSTISGAMLYTLTNPAPFTADHFGVAVAVSGTKVVVGADQDHGAPNNAGIAYVYDLSRANPTLPVFTLTNPAPAARDAFGAAVSISGTLVVVGAPADRTARAGHAYAYDLSSLTPTLPAITLTNSSPVAEDNFGVAVAISGTLAVVGANQGGDDPGQAFIFDLASPNPTFPVVTPRVLSTNGRFGNAVSISGNRVVIGARAHITVGTGDSQGIAFVYDLSGPDPSTPWLTLPNPKPQTSDFFGTAVSISGDRVVIGASGDNIGGDSSGSAYLYDLTSSTPTVPVVTLNNPTPAAGDSFGAGVALDNTTILVGTPGDDANGADRGAAYVFRPTPVLSIRVSQVELCWSSLNGAVYQLQYRSDLTTNTWVSLDMQITGDGMVTCVTDVVPFGQPQRYYRVQEVQ